MGGAHTVGGKGGMEMHLLLCLPISHSPPEFHCIVLTASLA